jgi:hypothetical protein
LQARPARLANFSRSPLRAPVGRLNAAIQIAWGERHLGTVIPRRQIETGDMIVVGYVRVARQSARMGETEFRFRLDGADFALVLKRLAFEFAAQADRATDLPITRNVCADKELLQLFRSCQSFPYLSRRRRNGPLDLRCCMSHLSYLGRHHV